MAAPNPGPPPPRPPNVGSPEREAWEAEVGEDAAYEAKQAWQKWFQQEEQYIADQIGSGSDLGEIVNPWGDDYYQNAPEKGASVYARWDDARVQDTRQQAFNRAKGHYAYDPNSGLYFNVINDPNNPYTWEWKDAQGNYIMPDYNTALRIMQGGQYTPAGYDPIGSTSLSSLGIGQGSYGGAYGLGGAGNVTPQTNRPYKKEANDSYWRGWGEHYGQDTDNAKNPRIVAGNAFGDLRVGGQNDPYGYVPREFKEKSGIPGLTQGY